MAGTRGLGKVARWACALVAVVCFAAGASAAPAQDGPAYGVEPGDSPKNSVPVGASAGSKPGSAPASGPSTAPAPSPPAPSAASPAPAPAPGPSTPPGTDAQSVDSASGPAPAGTTTSTQVSDNDPRALTDFRPQLDPYGQWVEDPKYGLVWVPDHSVVGDGFSPYVTAGHWALDAGGNWVWVSDYPFGDVVFHYGRWVWTSDYGWSWIPGYQYAPAWVVWRVPTDEYAYVGWAPAPPLFVWWGGIGMSLWWGAPYYWVFCPSRFVFSRYTSYYVVHDRAFARTLAGATHRYVAAPHVTSTGPSMQSARVPGSSVPGTRLPVASGRIPATGMHSAYSSSMAHSYSSRPSFQTAPASRVTPYAGQRGFPSTRTYSATPRSTWSGTYSPAPRPYSAQPPARGFSSPAYSSAPRTYSPSYSAAPRTYSAAPRAYSATPRVYSPSPRVYSTPNYSAPTYHATPAYHPSYSAPHMSAPHFSGGGGGRHR